jgi:hypothetical protein
VSAKKVLAKYFEEKPESALEGKIREGHFQICVAHKNYSFFVETNLWREGNCECFSASYLRHRTVFFETNVLKNNTRKSGHVCSVFTFIMNAKKLFGKLVLI